MYGFVRLLRIDPVYFNFSKIGGLNFIHKILLLIILLLLEALFIFYYYDIDVSLPSEKKVQELEKEVSILEEKINSENKFYKNKQLDLQKQQTILDSTMPNSINIPNLIKSIGMSAFNSNIYINSINISNENIKENIVAIPVSLSLSGKYKNFLVFLADIENSIHMVNIKKLTISSKNNKSDNLEFKSVLEFYFGIDK